MIGRGFVRDWAWNRNLCTVYRAGVLAASANVGCSQNGVLSLRVLQVKKKQLCMLLMSPQWYIDSETAGSGVREFNVSVLWLLRNALRAI